MVDPSDSVQIVSPVDAATLPLTTEVHSKVAGNVTFTVNLPDVTGSPSRRGVIRWTTDPTFAAFNTTNGSFTTANGNQSIVLTPLTLSTLYYVRVYIDEGGVLSAPVEGSFWSDRPPDTPVLAFPIDGDTIGGLSPIRFSWAFSDIDDGDLQITAHLHIRQSGTVPWTLVIVVAPNGQTYFDLPGGFLTPDLDYDWMVIYFDGAAQSSAESAIRTFHIGPRALAPLLLDPTLNEGIVASRDNTFKFLFRDPSPIGVQTDAELRYRKVGDVAWTTYNDFLPITTGQITVPAGSFVAGFRYEWAVRTQSADPIQPISAWSDSDFFHALVTPNSGGIVPVDTEPQGTLGCGTYRVYAYDRGGQVRRGEITPIERLQWGRKRDDISNALFTTIGYGEDCGELLKSLRTWMHEIVIYRDGERVWEGPISRITDDRGSIEIEAKDCMNYVYRRILRTGYNDAYRLVDGIQQGLTTVTKRAEQITLNALAYDDPNLIQYLTTFTFDDDTRQSRVVKAYSKTAWGEIDDLAATAGLDYTTVGRRIMFWDTHRPIGTLAEMREGDFSDPLIVTEYGMQLANVFAVTNNADVYGIADRLLPDGSPEFYGFIEQLASAYGEATGAAPTEVLTPEAEAELIITLTAQAERNINGRYPAPVIVRVPDNTRIMPDAQVGIQQLIPGVWIPLRGIGHLRKVTQTQKLDSVSVVVGNDGTEDVQVILSPAPLENIEGGEGA